jgi:hypothetical protein
MMKAPVMPLATLSAVEPCLCAWYQWVPGACPMTWAGRPSTGFESPSRKQYGDAPSWYCGQTPAAICASLCGQSCMSCGSLPGFPW